VPRLVILPGTDGTGALLGDFVALLGDLNPLVITYPTQEPLGYEQLAEVIRPQLPTTEPYYLLGESFGGPLAILLAAGESKSPAGLILCASFARYPMFLPRALAPLAVATPIRLVPNSTLSWFLFGHWSSPSLQAKLSLALASVSAETLRARIRAALHVDVTSHLSKLAVPVLYLQATHDRVVPAAAGKAVLAATARASLKQVCGPHFLLQAAPDACAREIHAFLGC